MKPFSKNIVFVDTEFSDLDVYKGELLSVGMVKPTGEELYFELEYDGGYSGWVTEHVLPTLTDPKVSREIAKKKIRDFLGTSQPYLLAFINQYDDVYMSKLFIGEEKPYNYMPLDLATILFFNGIDPQGKVEKALGLELPNHREHHALDDAKWVRDIYLKLLK